MTNALISAPTDLEALKGTAKLFMEAGIFSDTKTLAQAATKIMAGQEMGLKPFESMTSIDLIQGRACVTSNFIARRVKEHPAYDYEVIELTNDTCKIQFKQNGEPQGAPFAFTMEDAKLAGKAASHQYRQHPRQMLFARCISNGARIHCPDVFTAGPVYTAEELQGDLTFHTNKATVSSPPESKMGSLSVAAPKGDAPAEEEVVVLSDPSSATLSTNSSASIEPNAAWDDQLQRVKELFEELDYPQERQRQGVLWASKERTAVVDQLTELEADNLIAALTERAKMEG